MTDTPIDAGLVIDDLLNTIKQYVLDAAIMRSRLAKAEAELSDHLAHAAAPAEVTD